MKICPKCNTRFDHDLERCTRDGELLLEESREEDVEELSETIELRDGPEGREHTDEILGDIEDLIFKVCSQCHTSFGGDIDVCPQDGTRLRENSMLGRETSFISMAGLKEATLATSDLKKYCPRCKSHFPLHCKVCEKCQSRLLIPTLGGGEAETSRDQFSGILVADKYRLLKDIGAGGFGSVYLAKHESLGKRFAVKMLRAQLSDNTTFRNRFHEEALKLSRLEDETIVKVIDFGEWKDSQYMVTDYVDGDDLGSLIYGERMSPLRAARIMRQVAGALAEAHSKKIVHLDLKPANILVAHKRGRDLVRVIDFGIAELYSERGPKRQQTVAGTCTYMAPEQWQRKPLDPRTDIYSFGVILYECLAGRPPFRRKKLSELQKAHCTSRPAALRKVRPDVPVELERIVHRCLEKNPKNRIESAESLEAALDKYVRRTENVLGRWLGRVAAVVVIALLLAGGIWWVWNTWVADREPPTVTLDVEAPDGQELWPVELAGFQKAYETRGVTVLIRIKATDDRELKELIFRSDAAGKETFPEGQQAITRGLADGLNRFTAQAVDGWGNESKTVSVGIKCLRGLSRTIRADFLEDNGEGKTIYTSSSTVNLEIAALVGLKAKVVRRNEDSAAPPFEVEEPQTLVVSLEEGANTITISTVDLRSGETFGDDLSGVVTYLDPDADPLEVKATVRETDDPDVFPLEGENRWVSAKDKIRVTIDVEVPDGERRLAPRTDLLYSQDDQPPTKEDLTGAKKTLRVTLGKPGEHTITIEPMKDRFGIWSKKVSVGVEWEQDKDPPELKLETSEKLSYYHDEPPIVRFSSSDPNPQKDDAAFTLERIDQGETRDVRHASFQLAADGLWELRFTSPEEFPADGTYEFRIQARDKLGNSTGDTVGNFTVVADHTDPEIQIVSPQDGEKFKRHETIRFAARVTEAFLDKVEVAVGETTFPLLVNSMNGVWETEVKVDSSGVEKPETFDSQKPGFVAVFRATDRGGKSDEKKCSLRFAWENGDKLRWATDGSVLVFHRESKSEPVPFWIAAQEVRNEQYARFLDHQGLAERARQLREKPDLPVTGLSFEEMEAYAEWAGLKIPRRSQWLVAAFWDYRGSEWRTYPWGNDWPKPVRAGETGSEAGPAATNAYAGGATPFGVLNMFGNVWEVVLHENKPFRVGGAFNTDLEVFQVQDPLYRSYLRGEPPEKPAEFEKPTLGFRCVLVKGNDP